MTFRSRDSEMIVVVLNLSLQRWKFFFIIHRLSKKLQNEFFLKTIKYKSYLFIWFFYSIHWNGFCMFWSFETGTVVLRMIILVNLLLVLVPITPPRPFLRWGAQTSYDVIPIRSKYSQLMWSKFEMILFLAHPNNYLRGLNILANYVDFWPSITAELLILCERSLHVFCGVFHALQEDMFISSRYGSVTFN